MVKVVCPYCFHNQETKSKLKNITCSSCQKKFNPSKPIGKQEAEEFNEVIKKEGEAFSKELKKLKLD